MSTNPSLERRRKPEIVRQEALGVGRRLLIEGGPRAVTLKAVGAALGMSHANLIHHFGSADAFQAQIKDSMVEDLTRRVTALVGGDGAPADTASIVAQVFDAYGKGGIGMLMAWSTMTGAPHDKEGLAGTTRDLVAALAPRIEGENANRRARELVALVTLLAFADALIGGSLAEAVGQPREAVRTLTTELVGRLAAPPKPRDPQAR